MTRKTVSDYDSAELLAEPKEDLASRASYHGVRSVRTVVNSRYDVPALRVESRYKSLNVSVSDVKDEYALEMVSGFATEEGNFVAFLAPTEATRRMFASK